MSCLPDLHRLCCRADEGAPLLVFVPPRRLPDKGDGSILGALAGHDLGTLPGELTLPAVGYFPVKIA